MIQKQIQGRQKRKKAFKKEALFFSSCLQMGNTCFGNSFDEASEFHCFDTRVLFAAARLCSHAMLSSAGAQSPRFGLFKHTHARTHGQKRNTSDKETKTQASSLFIF